MEDELRQWRAFLAISRHGGFTSAALAEGMSQPHLSRHLAALERRMGVQLYDRNSRRVRLTATGAELLDQARDVLGRFDDLESRARKIAKGEQGVLLLGASTQTLVSFVAPVVGAFKRKHPGLEVRLVEGHADELVSAVAAGRLEFAVVGSQVEPPLRATPLYRAEICLYTRPAERRERLRRIDIAQLHAMPLLVLTRASLTRRIFDAACLAAGVKPEIRLESENAEALLALVEEGYGDAILPSTVLCRSPRVRGVPLTAGRKTVCAPMNLIWNPELFHARGAVLLSEEIRRLAARQKSAIVRQPPAGPD